MGCCDSSPNQHASRHAREDEHPLIRSIEPGETWSYCFIDDQALLIDLPVAKLLRIARTVAIVSASLPACRAIADNARESQGDPAWIAGDC